MRRLSDRLGKVSTGWVALAATVAFVLFVAFVLPAQAPIEAEDGGDVGSPDLSLWYSADELYDIAESYGPEGRERYVRARVTFDVAWPLVYTVFLTTTISWAGSRIGGRFWPRVNLVPVAAGAFDLLENATTVLVMVRYPARTPLVEWLAPVFTFTKWALLSASFALLLAALLVVAWHRIGRAVRESR
jgi:hypothetical protein